MKTLLKNPPAGYLYYFFALAAIAGLFVNVRPGFIPAGLFFFRRRFLCAVLVYIILSRGAKFFWSYRFFSTRAKQLRGFVEARSFILLCLICLILITWLGYIIFRSPYLYEFNQGNGAYYAQVLHNLCGGIGPEQTTKANGALYFRSNPYFYASIFSTVPQILPLIVLTPLYCIYPYPPMQVFSMVIVCVVLGLGGMFSAVRAAGGGRALAVTLAAGYCLLPWFIEPILYHGAFDNLGFAVYPYVFAFLLVKRWKLFFACALALGLISTPYAYSLMALGITIGIFFRSGRQGLAVGVLGFLIMSWHMLIVKESLSGIVNYPVEPRNFFVFLNRESWGALPGAARFYAFYIFCLLASLSFLPLAGLRTNKRWDWPLIGLLGFGLSQACFGLFRSYAWTFHRNANLVVPFYLAAVIVYIRLASDGRPDAQRIRVSFFSALAAVILCFSWHYPWAGFKTLQPLARAEDYRVILDRINAHVPAKAAVAYRVEAGLEAFVTNRQHAWPLGYHPDGVQYYIIQTQPIRYITDDFPRWSAYFRAIQESGAYKPLYTGSNLRIYENLNPGTIPRSEDGLGWDVLWRGLTKIAAKRG